MDNILSYSRSLLDALFDSNDANVSFTYGPFNHKGLYIGIVDSSGNPILREGFLKDGQVSIRNSINIVVNDLYKKSKDQNISREKLRTSSFYVYVIKDCIYIKDPLDWDENIDGIYFMWGQRFKGLYLPYQIKRMQLSKIETLDHLLSQEVGVVSSLWRLSEGLVHRIVCDHYFG